jgi:hypothetical protein
MSAYKYSGPDGERARIVDGKGTTEGRADKSQEQSRLHCRRVEFLSGSRELSR